MSSFDRVAAQFEFHRSFPPEVTNQICDTVRAELPHDGKILEIGAGTGRFGKALVQAGCDYFGVDQSLEMLREFSSGNRLANLVQADAHLLPFTSQAFSGVLLFHFFNASIYGDDLFAEIARVLVSGGVVLVGKRVGPIPSIDAQMRDELRSILGTMSIQMPEAGRGRSAALTQLQSMTESRKKTVAAVWKSEYCPDEFLQRHRTGAWFSQLEEKVQNESLARLGTWAKQRFGSLNAESVEEYRFELDIFRF